MTWQLRPRATFGKTGATRDYAWNPGDGAVPAAIRAIAPRLAEHCARHRISAVCVAPHDGVVSIARASPIGPDASGRPVVGVVVTDLVAHASADAWCALAASALTAPVDALEIDATAWPAAQPVSAEQMSRTALGLPVTATPGQAVELLLRAADRFDAVVWAQASRENSAAFDVPVAALLVDLAAPPAAHEDAALLAACERLDPAELDALAAMPLSPARRAMQWLIDVQGSACGRIEADDALVEWIVGWRSRRAQGSELFETLRRDLADDAFRHAVLVVARALPEDARSVLMNGGAGGDGTRGLDELARRGLLDTDAAVPLGAWIGRAAQSPLLRQVLTRRLAAHGISESAVTFILDQPESPGTLTLPPGLDAAIRLAVGAGLPAPLARVRSALRAASSTAVLHGLAHALGPYGGTCASLAAACAGELDHLSALEPCDLARVIGVRTRASGMHAAIDVVAALFSAGRDMDVRTLLQQAPPSGFDDDAIRLLAARAGLTGPAVLHAGMLASPLITRGLIRLRDVVPEDLAAAAELSRHWPDAAALCAPVTGAAHVPDLRECTDAWSAFLSRRLDPPRAASWLAACGEAAHGDAIEVIAALRPDARAAISLLRGRPRPDLPMADVLAWLAAVAVCAPVRVRLHALSALADLGELERREADAATVVGALLPRASNASREWALYALTRVGPPPAADGVDRALLAALATAVDPVALVEALMRTPDGAFDDDAGFVETVVNAVCDAGVPYPRAGFSRLQRARHPALAHRLGAVPGWEAIALERSEREAAARAYLRRLDLEDAGRHSLSEELP